MIAVLPCNRDVITVFVSSSAVSAGFLRCLHASYILPAKRARLNGVSTVSLSCTRKAEERSTVSVVVKTDLQLLQLLRRHTAFDRLVWRELVTLVGEPQ